MNTGRIKIKPVYPTNLFYEKVLADWKSNATDPRGSRTIKTALDNLKLCPLLLDGYTDLRKIKGIGEDIASRLNAAAQCFVERSGEMTLQKVRALKSGTTLEYLRGGVVTKGRKNVPFLSQQPQAAFQSTGIRLGTLGNDDVPIRSTQNDAALRDPTSVVSSSLNTSFSQPAFSSADMPGPSCSSMSQQNRQGLASQFIKPKKPAKLISDKLLEYDPVLHSSNELVLIVDNRENRSGKGQRKSISEHLKKRSVNHELRPLAVGDYIWIVKMGHGDERELVLDYVVERKTWDDLRMSIRGSRYVEQKQRLCLSGIENIVMIAEGSDKNVDRSLEQALVSTSLENGFLIQRTDNLAGTARFLEELTKHLQKRMKEEKLTGHSFAWIQSESQKTKDISVSDLFIRQLTVCPNMSTNRAAEVARQFPSIRALWKLYKNCDTSIPLDSVLKVHVPSVQPGLSAQMGQFFKSEYPTG